METSRKALRLTSSVCLLVLAACSGGGGGGASVNTTPGNNTGSTGNTGNNAGNSSSGSTSTPPPTVSIAPPNSTGVAGMGGSGSNFTTNPPTVGSTISLNGNSVIVTSTSVADSGIANNTIAAVYRGTVTSNGVTVPVFDFSIPSLSVTASNLRGDGTPLTLSNGGQLTAAFATMTYTLVGAWAYTPSSGGSGYLGQVVTGYSTAPSAVPTTGTASYAGNPNIALGGGVIGAYAVPAGNGTIQAGTLAGNVSINANFAANTATGNFTNMVATPATGGGAATPWNDVSFSANFTRNSGAVTMNGMVTAAAPPANAGVAGFAAGSTGSMTAEFYGPAAQEVGGNWVMRDGTGSAGGKAAFGTFGAK